MRRSWHPFALMLLAGVGCAQLPAGKSVQDLRPIQPSPDSAKKQEPPTVDIARSLLQQAELLDRTGRTSDAIAAYEKVRINNGPDTWQATRKLAMLHYRVGDLDRAEKEFTLLKQQNPKDAQTLTYLGNIAYQRGQFGIAENCYSNAVFHQPDYADAWSGLGMTIAQDGERWQKSKECFAKVVSEAEAYCCVARIMNQQGRRQDAYRAYQTALNLDPNLAQAKAEIARLQHTLLTDPPTTVTLTTHLKAEKRGSVELEDVQTRIIEGARRFRMQRPTLPPLPDIGDWPAEPKR